MGGGDWFTSHDDGFDPVGHHPFSLPRPGPIRLYTSRETTLNAYQM
jgi:hypothetical protein